jgi:hypothetical protein
MDRIKKLVKEIISEKKIKRDRCLRIADRKFDKPSAYKSGAVVRCRAGKIWKKLKENNNSDDYLKKVGIELYNYIPHSFPPDLTSLNKQEYEVVINDLRKEKMGLVDYLQFVNSMSGDPVYKSILLKLVKGNKNKIEFTLDQNEMIKYEGLNKLQKFKNFYEKYKDSFPNWASENKRLYDDVINALKSSLNEAEKETLRTWFKRKGAPGKTGGWVD